MKKLSKSHLLDVISDEQMANRLLTAVIKKLERKIKRLEKRK